MAKAEVTAKKTCLTKRAGGATLQKDGEVKKYDVLIILESKSKIPGYLRVKKENGTTGYINKRDVRCW